jgi:hypothetical protein
VLGVEPVLWLFVVVDLVGVGVLGLVVVVP